MKFKWETEFKETEIGEIPRDWEIVYLQDKRFFEILPSGIEKFEGTKEYLSTSSVQGTEIVKIEETVSYKNRPSRANMQPVKNSVWIARMINSLKVLKAGEDLIKNKILSTGFLGVKTTSSYSADFLFYYFITPQFQEYKDAYVTGAVQESLTNESASKLLVPLLNCDEQSRIATVLSWFDDLIENKRKQNEILEKTAMALFKSWFIDFEPFQEGEFVYNEELAKEIPKGWEVRAIGEIFKLVKGKKCRLKNEPLKGYRPYLLIDTYKSGNISYWTDEKEPYVDELDIVIVADGESSGKLLRLQTGILGSTLLMLRPKIVFNAIGIRDYTYLMLKGAEEDLTEHRTGSAIPHLDKDYLLSLKILLPPSSVLQKFHSLVEPLFQKIILNQKQIMLLRRIRNTLLPELVFGKLRVVEL